MQEQRYKRCAAPGCFQVPRPFSRYCPHHYRKQERTRDFRDGRVLRKGELKYARSVCLDFIERHKQHPAIVAALEYLWDFLKPSDRAEFLRSEFDRLRANGATPELMLASAMAVYFWCETHGHWGNRPLWNDRCTSLNIGRAVLGTVPARQRRSRTGQTHYVRIRPSHAESLGLNLKLAIGGLCALSVRKILKDSGWYAPDERGRLIREAIERAPFEEVQQDEKE